MFQPLNIFSSLGWKVGSWWPGVVLAILGRYAPLFLSSSHPPFPHTATAHAPNLINDDDDDDDEITLSPCLSPPITHILTPCL